MPVQLDLTAILLCGDYGKTCIQFEVKSKELWRFFIFVCNSKCHATNANSAFNGVCVGGYCRLCLAYDHN